MAVKSKKDIKLKDVIALCHAKPKDAAQAALWKSMMDGTLESADTWEVALSAGGGKKEVFERLMREGKLGGLAVLRNLRNMQQAHVDDGLIRERLSAGISRAFPYRFVVAAKYAPTLEDAIEKAMFKAVEQLDPMPGKTGLLIDVSGSMDAEVSSGGGRKKSPNAMPTSRIDVAVGLAILLREKAEQAYVATFSHNVVEVPPRRGFALRDAIHQSQQHGGTYLRGALEKLSQHFAWKSLDRLIVITDEQSQDGIAAPWLKRSYVINVAPEKNGVSYRNGYTHIDGWSERCLDYIREIELEEAA